MYHDMTDLMAVILLKQNKYDGYKVSFEATLNGQQILMILYMTEHYYDSWVKNRDKSIHGAIVESVQFNKNIFLS